MQNTAKLWCGTPPALTLSVRVEKADPVIARKRSSIELPTAVGVTRLRRELPDPVGVDHPAVEWVVEAERGRDELEVRPGSRELAGEGAKAEVDVVGRPSAPCPWAPSAPCSKNAPWSAGPQ